MNLGRLIRSSFNLKHIFTIGIAAASFSATLFLFNDELDALGRYSGFLGSRNYSHSVLVDRPIEQDSYALYGKRIMFSIDDTMSAYLNCEVLMESGNAHSEKDFLYPYQPSSLGANEVAISKNLLKKHGLSIGAIVYSKHIVKNEVVPYAVKAELPDIYGLKEKDFHVSNGVVLFGFDPLYFDNISTDHIFFYDSDSSLINKANATVKGGLVARLSAKQFIDSNQAKDVAITSAVSLSISTVFTVLLVSFNKSIYFYKKRLGNQDTYSFFVKHAIGYDLLATAITLLLYFILGIWNPIVPIEIMCFLLSLFIPSFIINSLFYRKLKKS